jgi:cysteine-rich repeat protein
VIDAATPTPDGAPMLCGDGMRVRGEECDDANTAAGDGCDATCRVEPYVGAPQAAIDAMRAINPLRAAADLPGALLQGQIVQAAQDHASYYSNNAAAYTGGLSAHEEDPAYPNGFTGVTFSQRMTAAGFAGAKSSEVMAFAANPTSAVAQWLNSVYHRIPLLHPNTRLFGYGGSNASGRNADVIDFSNGTAERATAVTVWPPPGATGVPRSFNRLSEGPNPPTPPGGGNVTGPIVSVFFATGQSGTLTSQSIEDSNGTPLAITVTGPGGLMSGSYAFYAAGPASAGATFTVRIAGSVGGQPFSTSWTFTTQ